MAQLDYLVTGGKGQLGRAVTARANARGARAYGVDVDDMPLENRNGIFSMLVTHRPRWIVHCGAITNVDGCEQEPLAAYRVNALATAWLAEAASSVGAGFVYISTDFVFDGAQQGEPYAVDAVPRPLSVYGASKRLGEEAVLAAGRPDFYVVRTSWVFGPGGNNFPRAILARARSGQPLKVVTDQVGRPTFTHDLADAVLDLADKRPAGGIYHAANEGFCSWRQFAIDILREAGLGQVAVGEQLAAELARPAPRPAWSVLDTSVLAGVRQQAMPHYVDAIGRYLAAERQLADSQAASGQPGSGQPGSGQPGSGQAAAGQAGTAAAPEAKAGTPLRGKEYRS